VSGVYRPKNTTFSGGSKGLEVENQEDGAPTLITRPRERCGSGSAARCSAVSTRITSADFSAPASIARSAACFKPPLTRRSLAVSLAPIR
jgi:hypothetical protein